MKRTLSALLMMLALLVAAQSLAAPCQGKHCGRQHHQDHQAASCGERCGPCASSDTACAEACAARRASCRKACAAADAEMQGCAKFRARHRDGHGPRQGAQGEVRDAGRR